MATVRGRLLDRQTEMAALSAAWEDAGRGRPQLVVLWGRRRVGKTFLLSHFVADKHAVFFGATEQSEAIELARLSDAIGRDLGQAALDLAGGGFSNWEAALRYFAALARNEPVALVLDEVPYLTRSTPGFPSIVQAVWDHIEPGTKLLLVLTGSAVGMIEKMVGASGALRGRPTVARHVEPITLTSASDFLPRLGASDLIEAYAACGGYPLHLLSWDATRTAKQNLFDLATTPGGLLVNDAASILREELPDVGGYPRVLAAIGRGRTRISQIAADADQRVEHPLGVLVQAGFVRRSVPIGAPRRARPIYEIADPYLAFWFAVIYADRHLIDGGQGRAVLQRRTPQWQRHLGWIFEEASRAHAARLVARGDLPDDFVVGRWWAASGPPAEADVLGLRGPATGLVGEARWQDRPLGARDAAMLRHVLDRVPNLEADPILALWGRSGVDRAVQRSGVLGFSADDVVRP